MKMDLPVLAGGMLAVSLMLAPAPASAQAFSESEREEIGEIVREYLLQNPGLLEEVIAALEEQQRMAQAEAEKEIIYENRDALFRSPDSFVAGNPEGDVALVEFFDFNCGYCRQMLPVLMELIDRNPDLRLVLKDWPVLGEESAAAARVSVAVKQTAPDSYLDFHRAMMSQNGRIDGERALAVAGEVGLDRAAIERASREAAVDDTLRQNVQLGARLGLRGTPSYVLGDEVLAGALRMDTLQERIAEVREEGCAAC